jgi:hypothetical protein
MLYISEYILAQVKGMLERTKALHPAGNIDSSPVRRAWRVK